jgi:hypothetical protein
MKAFVCKAPLNSLSRRCRHAVPASGKMQVSVEITNMCGTDVHINGERPPLLCCPGRSSDSAQRALVIASVSHAPGGCR